MKVSCVFRDGVASGVEWVGDAACPQYTSSLLPSNFAIFPLCNISRRLDCSRSQCEHTNALHRQPSACQTRISHTWLCGCRPAVFACQIFLQCTLASKAVAASPKPTTSTPCCQTAAAAASAGLSGFGSARSQHPSDVPCCAATCRRQNKAE